jgi:hypothetical protein
MMDLLQKVLLAITAAVCTTAAVTTLVSLPSQAERFHLTWGAGDYVWVVVPHVVMMILAISFRKTLVGAMISLTGAVIVGAGGHVLTYSNRDAIGVGLAPFILLAGCGVVLLLQLARWALMRRSRPPS